MQKIKMIRPIGSEQRNPLRTDEHTDGRGESETLRNFKSKTAGGQLHLHFNINVA